MKLFILLFTCVIFLSFNSNAQTDQLVVKLKSGTSDTIDISKLKMIKFENITAVAETQPINSNLIVGENHPNPFSEQTSLDFEIANSGSVEVVIYNNNGNQVKTLKCDNCQSGKNALLWNCLDMNNNRVQSGVYYYEIRFGNEIQSKKMIVIK